MIDKDSQAFRIGVFQVLLVIVAVIYTIRLFSMQILSGDVHLTRAQDISRRTFVIPAQRGEIYDRNYDQPLVMNRDSFAVSITPAEVPRGSMPGIIEDVSKILNISVEEISARMPRQYLQLYQPVEIAANVPFAAIAALAERKNTLPGVSWQSKPVRSYDEVGSLAHILGYVGDITRDELTTLFNQGYQQGDVIGKTGVERQYDLLLRGKEGREIRTVDVRGRRIASRENLRIPPEMGKNLVLTIDADLQTLVEKALGPRIGAAVVVRPSTGEVLAMVSYPWYDPAVITDGHRSEYIALLDDPNKPFLNRTFQAAYPPASTFKIIMSTAVLAEGTYSPENTVLCQGVINFGNRDWGCWIRRPGHGRLNLRRALAHSCNIYYMEVGRDRLGVDRIGSYAREMGYGEATNIDLPGPEMSGLVPTPRWKEQRLHERWVAGDTMNMSIGQGFMLVTPLQMTNMLSMVMNDGIIYKPHVLKEVRDSATGAVEQSFRPVVLRETNIAPEVFETVRRDMRAVVTEGTARFPLNMRSVQIAAKTGTAEVGLPDRWHSWLAAFGPYDNPNAENAIAVSIIVEAANRWEWWATYATAIVFQGYFANQPYEQAVRSLGLQYLAPIQERRE